MPQFDTFSFFSQLFWVFLSFIFFYLILSLFLLPAISSTLKIRKRKLAQIGSTNTTNVVSDAGYNVSLVQTNNLIMDFSSKIFTITNNQYQVTALTTALSFFTVKIESFRKLQFALLNQLQATVLFF